MEAKRKQNYLHLNKNSTLTFNNRQNLFFLLKSKFKKNKNPNTYMS